MSVDRRSRERRCSSYTINSVCAQKVRIALAEKELPHKEHLMTLGGDQFDPAYMKLNPNAVVPTAPSTCCVGLAKLRQR